MPPPLLTLYTTSWGFFFLCWEREKAKKLAWEKQESRPGELRLLPSALSPQLWAPPQPVSPRGARSPAQPPQGLHGLKLPHAHRHALTPKLSSALKTPPRASSSCSFSHRVWSLQLKRQSC